MTIKRYTLGTSGLFEKPSGMWVKYADIELIEKRLDWTLEDNVKKAIEIDDLKSKTHEELKKTVGYQQQILEQLNDISELTAILDDHGIGS